MTVSLIQNAALLLAMVFLYDLVVSSRVPALSGRDIHDDRQRIVAEVITGVVLGAIGVAVMASSFELQDGVILDTRSVMLAAVGLFFGGIPVLFAMVITAVYRLRLGGAGTGTGVVVILATGSIGWASRRWLRDRLANIRWYQLLIVGLVAHLAMLAVFVLVPFSGSDEVVRNIAVPVLVIYPVAFVVFGALLSRRLRAAELTDRLAMSEAEYRAVFENDHLVMLVIDPETGAILDANGRAAAYYGYSRDQLLAMNTSDLEVLPRDEVIRQIDETQAAGRNSYEFQHRLASGELRDVEVIGGAVTVGGRMRIHAVINDVTDRKRTETELVQATEQLRQAQKMEAIGRLAGGIAHDFNNMLQVITGYTDLAMSEVETTSDLYEYLREVRHAAQRSAELTQQLLAFARRQTSEPRVVRAEQVVAASARMLQRLVGADVNVRSRVDELPWPVRIDPGQLDQVLTNLTLNAREAMHGGGSIELAVRNVVVDELDPEDPVEARMGEFVEISVIDDGEGIPPEDLDAIFEPFFTTKSDRGGTGLGLSIVYGIVTQHDGFVRVRSHPGDGSTFSILLPRCDGAVFDPDEIGGAASVEIEGGVDATVLLVDDEPGVRRLAERILDRLGCQVLIAASGDEALEVAAAHDGPIDLLVTDVVMPGLDVRAMVERLRAVRPALPVLYVSGFTGDVIAQRSLSSENVDLLTKPFGAEQLRDRVLAALGRTGSGPG